MTRSWSLPAILGLLLASAQGCSMLVDFPADCVDDRCPGGFTCEPDGVQCRTTCLLPSDCRSGFFCEDGGCVPQVAGDAGAGDSGGASDAGLVDAGPPVPDRDQDRVPDRDDLCPDEPDPDQSDVDGDRVGDLCDLCPDVSDPDQSDADGDRVGDLCDLCPDVPDPDQVDTDHDGLGDPCDPCPRFADRSLRAGDCPSVEEVEPNGAKSAGMILTPPVLVAGRLTGDDPYASGADRDVYLVRGSAGAILDVQLVSGAEPGPELCVRRPRAPRECLGLVPSGPRTLRRQVPLTTDGWVVVELELGRADAGVTYELIAQWKVPEAGASGLPFGESVHLGPGEVSARRVRPREAGWAEVRFDPGPGANHGGTSVFRAVPRRLVALSGAGPATAWVEGGEEYIVIHEPGAWDDQGLDGRWSVTYAESPPCPRGGEPGVLSLPGEVTCPIAAGEPQPWRLAGRAGEPVEIRLSVGEGAGLVACLFGPSGARLTCAKAAHEARIVTILPWDGLYTMVARLTMGQGQDYTVTCGHPMLDPVDLPPPSTVQGQVTSPGRPMVFQVPAARGRRVVVDISPGVDPVAPGAMVLGPGNQGIMAQGMGLLRFVPQEHRGYTLLVSDLLGRPGQTGRATVHAAMTPNELQRRAEAEPNDQPGDAGGLGLAPVEVAGTLDSSEGDQVDTFRFDVHHHARVYASVRSGPGEERPADLILTVSTAAGSVLGRAEGEHPSLGPLPLLADESQGLLVELRLDGPGRVSYVLELDGVVCRNYARKPGPGELSLLEILQDPGNGVDIDGDGSMDEADRFLELKNVTNEPLDIGGLVVVSGHRGGVPCGTVVPPGGVVVLMGDSVPAGDLHGARVIPVEPGGVLPGPGETVELREVEAGDVVLRVDPGPSRPGVSRVRYPEDGDVFMDHDRVPEAGGASASPGAKVDGTTFTQGQPCVDDRACGLTEACRIQVEGQAVVRRCGPRAGRGRAGDGCDQGGDCRSGRCGDAGAGESVCLGPCVPGDGLVCAPDTRCYEIGDRIFVGERIETIPVCAPDRGSEVPCAKDADCPPGEACALLPNAPLTGWSPACRVSGGRVPPGGACAADSDCTGGWCGEDPVDHDHTRCLGPCVQDGDCLPGTTCQELELDLPSLGEGIRAAPAHVCR